MKDAAARAARRRQEWTSEVVPVGTSKSGRTSDLTPEERWRALAALNVRAWIATGQSWPERMPRNEWPVEVYRLR